MWKNHREKVAIKWEYIQKKKCMYWRVEPPIYTYQIHIVCVIHIDIVIAWLDSKWIVCWGWACFSIAARRIPVNNFSDSNESVRQTRSRRRCGSVWVCVQVIGGEQDISLFCIMHTTYTIARCVCVAVCDCDSVQVPLFHYSHIRRWICSITMEWIKFSIWLIWVTKNVYSYLFVSFRVSHSFFYQLP